MGFKDILKKVGENLSKPSLKVDGVKKTPMEMELESYAKEDRERELKVLVMKKRRERNGFFHDPNKFNLNEKLKVPMGDKKLKVQKVDTNIFMKPTKKRKQKDIFMGSSLRI